jgi:hypothetical protein
MKVVILHVVRDVPVRLQHVSACLPSLDLLPASCFSSVGVLLDDLGAVRLTRM